MKIGIMGAMHEEVNSILYHMKETTTIELGKRKYFMGKIGKHEALLVFSKCGKVASAATASALITEFKVDQLIFTGVAGAANPHLNIGDVVIANKLYQHDMDARPLAPKFEILFTDTTFFSADNDLVVRAHNSVNKLFDSLSQKIPVEILESFYITAPKCMIGTIATGDQFISDSQNMQVIRTEMPDALAVEMEGAAVAQVCNDYNIPFTVIRTISDKANHKAVIDFPKFINTVACHYAEHIILDMLSDADKI